MSLMKKLTLGPDARSSRGIMARGKAIYHGGTHSAKTKQIRMTPAVKRAIQRRMRGS